MSMLKISGSNMEKDAEAILEKVEESKKHIFAMKEAVDSLSACWTGPAAETYKAQVYADIAYMSEVCAEIETYLTSISEAKKDYAKAESDVYRNISRMWIW